MISQIQMEAIIQEVINHCQWMKDKNRPFESTNVQRMAERLMKEQNLTPNNRCFVYVQNGVADHVCDSGVEVVTFDFDTHEAQSYKSTIPEHFKDLVEGIFPDDESIDGFGEDTEDNECHTCNGTGEGMFDGQSCAVCRGKGFR